MQIYAKVTKGIGKVSFPSQCTAVVKNLIEQRFHGDYKRSTFFQRQRHQLQACCIRWHFSCLRSDGPECHGPPVRHEEADDSPAIRHGWLLSICCFRSAWLCAFPQHAFYLCGSGPALLHDTTDDL